MAAAAAATAAVMPQKAATDEPVTSTLSLAELVEALGEELSHSKEVPLAKKLKIKSLLEAFDHTLGELDRYAHFDPAKKYTRNLIATDDETFTLMLLCWNAGKESPVHDHPCIGCWMRVVSGSIIEHRYSADAATNTLVPTSVNTASEGAVLYIDDDIGLHKIVNPSPDRPAMSLHLYAPPFNSCRIWLDGTPADKPLRPIVSYYSQYGAVVSHERDAPAAGCDLCS